jgi:hypothetical protein
VSVDASRPLLIWIMDFSGSRKHALASYRPEMAGEVFFADQLGIEEGLGL